MKRFRCFRVYELDDELDDEEFNVPVSEGQSSKGTLVVFFSYFIVDLCMPRRIHCAGLTEAP